jgi:hypothetical protein
MERRNKPETPINPYQIFIDKITEKIVVAFDTTIGKEDYLKVDVSDLAMTLGPSQLDHVLDCVEKEENLSNILRQKLEVRKEMHVKTFLYFDLDKLVKEA